MNGPMQRLNETVSFLKEKGFEKPDLGIVLGTGLGKLAEEIEVTLSLGYNEIPHFPNPTVEFHSGRLIFGKLEGKTLIAFQGRYHYYEGYSMEQIVLPVRVLKLLGAKAVLLSNAAGALHPDYRKGELMLIDDHINLHPENPLRGPNIDELGDRFPDMSAPYDLKMNEQFVHLADKLNLRLHQGVYASVPGPNLETRAEYRYLRTIGADAVGMSTVPEVIACKHMSLPCAAISVLTDECDPDNLQAADIAEIIAVAGRAEKDLTRLFKAFIGSFEI